MVEPPEEEAEQRSSGGGRNDFPSCRRCFFPAQWLDDTPLIELGKVRSHQVSYAGGSRFSQ
nr:hypothetical protein [Tengunoibacter tsumagoiensis]